MGVRRVRDAAFWGAPVGTPIAPGMKPAARMAKGATTTPAGRRPGSAAALFAAGAGKGRIHAATGMRPAPPAKKAPPHRTARSVFDSGRVAEVAQSLRTAPSLDAARSHLTGMTVAQLRQVVGHVGIAAPAKATKARLVDLLAEVAGRRLDSAALSRLR